MTREYKKSECKHCEKVNFIAAKGLCRACYSRLQKTGSLEFQRKGKFSICDAEGCDGRAITHGLCDKHRKRLARHGHINQTRPNDWGDRESHPLYAVWVQHRRYKTKHPLSKELHSDFWLFASSITERPSTNHHLRPIDESTPISNDNYDWVESAIKNMTTDDKKAYTTQWLREDRKRDPDKYKDKSLMKQYGIGLDGYMSMLEDQNGLCKICNNPETALNPKTKKPRDLAVDHCHTTGNVRGLLCTKCNTALGNFKDDISLLEAAIVYLNKNKTP